MNRLAREKSPYLLQHAQNPVDWFPWGDEAFGKARAESKPIFLSIGYSTCHWCHVMEHESFEDASVAAALNRDFVVDQARSRGAAGHRPRVHAVRAGDDRRRRLADERLADAGSPAVFRRDLLSADVALGPARASSTSSRRLRRAWKDERARLLESADGIVEPAPTDVGRRRAGGRSGARRRSRRARRRHQRVRAVVRSAARRIWRRAEVSAPVRAAVSLERACDDRETRARKRWRSTRCGRWRSAACAITSAAAFIATRWTRTGASRTSRRCSTTRRNSSSRISMRARRAARRSTPRSPRTRSTTSRAT